MPDKAPGLKWIVVLAIAGFVAGFVGPIIFVPDANQGPLVGILITGPAGVVAGILLWGVCALIKLPSRTQWRLLYAVATTGVLTTLLYVQPEPALVGHVFDGEVQSCASPLSTEESVLDYWDERIAKVTWENPRAGWQDDMHRLLRDAPGVVVSVRVSRKNAIRENRKPWNRGSRIASGWENRTEDMLLYDPNSSCDQYANGHDFRGFQEHDYKARIEPPTSWPPAALRDVLVASVMAPVPPDWANLH